MSHGAILSQPGLLYRELASTAVDFGIAIGGATDKRIYIIIIAAIGIHDNVVLEAALTFKVSAVDTVIFVGVGGVCTFTCFGVVEQGAFLQLAEGVALAE